ncbi:MAG: acylphosphatase [Candidatus Margulisbacteria bacterium]|jgi:acylphosphatase|nr:acylphosphatase [Candidatus Margulisiibacteriota bacterium]
MTVKRALVTYYGRVQGVGFRFTAEDAARNYAVTGYVRNMPDGSVEVVAEGEEKELNAFLTSVDDQLGQYVKNRNLVWLPATGEFSGFSIT